MTLTFSPANQNILAWATLHFAILHHCISSMLSSNQHTHCAQGPKSDYTHVYNHYLSNLLLCYSPFWSSSVFSMLVFLSFIPIQSPLPNWQHTIGTFTQIWLSSQSTLKKTQGTLHRLKLSFFFFFLELLWSQGSLLVWLSLVGVWCFYCYSNTLQLHIPICHSCGTSH